MPSPWTFLITLHAIAAGYALIFGAVNLLRRVVIDTGLDALTSSKSLQDMRVLAAAPSQVCIHAVRLGQIWCPLKA